MSTKGLEKSLGILKKILLFGEGTFYKLLLSGQNEVGRVVHKMFILVHVQDKKPSFNLGKK